MTETVKVAAATVLDGGIEGDLGIPGNAKNFQRFPLRTEDGRYGFARVEVGDPVGVRLCGNANYNRYADGNDYPLLYVVVPVGYVVWDAEDMSPDEPSSMDMSSGANGYVASDDATDMSSEEADMLCAMATAALRSRR